VTPTDIAVLTKVMGPVMREFTAKAVAEAVGPLVARNAALEQRILELEMRPEPQAGPVGPIGQKGADGAGIASLVISAEGRMLAHLTDGKSIDAGPVPVQKGERGDRGEMGPEGPAGASGARGENGTDGKDAPPLDMDAVVSRVLALVPPAEKGERGEPGPAGRDGIDGKDGAPGLNGKDGADGLAGKDGAAGRDGKDGAPGERGLTGEKGLDGIAGRDGRDGSHGAPGPAGEKGLDGRNGVDGLKGKDGADGLGFDDFDLTLDAARGWVLRLAQGDRSKEWELGIPFDAKVWSAGTVYPKGAGVTSDGHYWIAQTQTSEPPGEGNPAWRIAVRRGKQGREGQRGKDGAPGKDLTQFDPATGRKW
jgi:hypothetical protein